MRLLMEPIKVKAHHASNLNLFTTGEAEIANYDKSARTKRALKTLGLIWGLALLSVLLPLLHFFLPFLGIIIGPFLAIWVHGIESEIIGGSIPCPRCQSPVTIVKQRNRWPLKELCMQCSSEITVDRVTTS